MTDESVVVILRVSYINILFSLFLQSLTGVLLPRTEPKDDHVLPRQKEKKKEEKQFLVQNDLTTNNNKKKSSQEVE